MVIHSLVASSLDCYKYCTRKLQQDGECCAECSSSVLLEVQNIHASTCCSVHQFSTGLYIKIKCIKTISIENKARDRTLVNSMNMFSCHFSPVSVIFLHFTHLTGFSRCPKRREKHNSDKRRSWVWKETTGHTLLRARKPLIL